VFGGIIWKMSMNVKDNIASKRDGQAVLYLTLSGSSLGTSQHVNIVVQRSITGVIHVCIHLVEIMAIRWKFSF
jgi:hypothetical protein